MHATEQNLYKLC